MAILKASKVNTLFIGIMMVAVLLCWSSQVQAAQDGDYTYIIISGEAQITGYTGAGGDVTIPSTIGGFSVISIGEWAFRDCTSLTTISIPQGVTSIGEYAFRDCTGLTAISIPQGVTSIGNYAFMWCTSLTTINLPPEVTIIGSEAFYGCANLITISIPERVASIGDGAFFECTGLTIIRIPEGVTSIGYNTFGYCTSLTSINLPEGVTSIGGNAFYYCTGLTSISIPEGVTSIGDNAFYECTGLTSINIPEEVTSVGSNAFYNCTGLTSIRFNSAITTIFDSYYTIPEATKIIGYDPSTAKDYATKYNRTFEVLDTITGVSLNKNVLTINLGANETLTATITPDNATDKSVTWSVSSESVSNIVTVSASGLVTAVNAGTAVIRATSNSDPSKYAECTITVTISLTSPLISGRVLKPDGSVYTPGNDSNVYVVLRRQDNSGEDLCATGVNNDGSYKLGADIPSGDYMLTAYVNGSNNPYAHAIPIVVHITVGQLLTQDINLTEPLITGRVLKPDGSAFTPGNDSNVNVVLRRQDDSGEDLSGAGVNNDGSFRLGGNIPSGDYLLRANSNGSNNPYTHAIAVAVHITAGQLLTQDISLTDPLISGRVLKPDGSVYTPGNNSNVYVVLRRQDNSGKDLCGTGVNNDGSFRLGEDIPSGDYLLMANANGSNNPDASAIPVAVHITVGQLLTQNISLTNPIITGRVFKPDGSAFTPGKDSYVNVFLRRQDNIGEIVSGGGVNNDGSYKLGADIPSGDYMLTAYVNGSNNPYASAIPIVVHITVGQLLTQDINLTDPLITGRVLKPDGNVYTPGNDSNVYVVLRRQDDSGEDLSGADVNNDGSFRLAGDMPSGDYMLTAYANGSNNPYAHAIHLTVHITEGQLLTQDISLTNPLIIGSVLKPDGSAYTPGNDSNVYVLLRRQDNSGETVCGTGVNNDGSYKLEEDTPSGDYLLTTYVAGSNNPYANAVPVAVHITAGQMLTQNISLTDPLIADYSATSVVQVGINPNDGDSAGVFIGLKDIRDTLGNLVPNPNLAGYQIDVSYDHNQAKVLDIYDESKMGQFTHNNGVNPDKTSVAAAVSQGTSNFEKLFFVPLALIGDSTTSTNVTIKFTSLNDKNWNDIIIPDVTLTFQRGKIANEASQKPLRIVDAVAGLQYLAKIVEAGLAPGKVNVVNMASILPPESGATSIKPSVKDIIALMQYLVHLRNDYFITVDNPSTDILIGGNLELTGNLSAFGQTANKAIELAFQQVNDQGGILNGRKFKFISEDNQSDNSKIVTAATKLITQDKVVGIIGPMTSSGTNAEIPIVTENSVPVITPSGSHPGLTVKEDGQLNQWIFRACIIDPVQANAAAQFALADDINALTAAVILDHNDSYSQGLATAFIQTFTNGDGQIINQEQYIAGSEDFSAILNIIKSSSPDVVYLPSYYQDAGKIIKQARELGINMPFIGRDGWAGDEIYTIAGIQAMNNTYYTDHISLDDPAMAQFIIDYQEKYGEKPDVFAALAFDSALMYIKAIEIAGNTDRSNIREALENLTDLQGVSGNITVDPITHNPDKSVFIMENKAGEAVFVTKIDSSDTSSSISWSLGGTPPTLDPARTTGPIGGGGSPVE